MKPPSLGDFLFRTQVESLYRKFLKTAYRIPDGNTRKETIFFYKNEFLSLTGPIESRTKFAMLRNSVTHLAEMINRSGISKK